ncbi:rhomboid family intramembrane serine protease, partial [archaeon]|nr:rhomboid family intramembrane serine protease [archaeon]
TAVIILINLGVFVEELRVGEQIFQLFAVSPSDVYRYLTKGTGNIIAIQWGILASAFMHAGYIHLFGNMIFLSAFGPALEKKVGITKFCLFYLAALYVSFYTYVAVYPSSAIPVIGASGAIAAVMGAYLIFNPRAKIQTILPFIVFNEIIEIPSIVFILVWFALQAANGYLSIQNQTSVAWFSHIGGFAMGVFAGIQMKWLK